MSPQLFMATAIAPKPISIPKVRGKILATLNAQSKIALGYLNKTVETWSDPPKMVADIRYAGGDIYIIAGPIGGDDPSMHWYYLDIGTSVRYADLSPDWRSKTRVRTLASYKGQGKVLARGRNARPHPGIAARQWSTIIAERMFPGFVANINRAIREGLEI